MNHDLRCDEVGGEAEPEKDTADNKYRVAIDAIDAGKTANDGADEDHDAVDWDQSGRIVILTSNAPAATKVVVDVDNNRADKEPGNVANCIEEAETPTGGKAEISLPRLKGLETRDQGAVV